MNTTRTIWAAIQRKLKLRPDGVPGALTASAVAVALGVAREDGLPGAGERFLWRVVQATLGLYDDGIPGPLTAAAVARKLGIELPAAVVNGAQWPEDRESALRAFYGAPGTSMERIIPPYQLYYAGDPVSEISVHEKISGAVLAALSEVLEIYGERGVRELKLDQYDGCFNNRPKRGGRSLSVHAFSAALDFCASENALHEDHTTALFAHPRYEPWWLAWERVGAVSLGRERDFDWMHVQFARLPG
jgi:hypothetical protein